MNRIAVSSEREYEVLVGANWLTETVNAFSSRERVAVIISKEMRSHLPEFPSTEAEIFVFEIPDGEAGKSSKTLNTLWNWLGAAGFTRSDLIVAIGGGATTDFAGFVAATWLRGIDWIAIPTTVAGMVDAAIGGKTAVNSEYGKNLIGAFHSPIQVVLDLQWLKSLSDRDFVAGMAEVVKTGLIADRKILDLLADKSVASLRDDDGLVRELITRTVAVKAEVVSNDFKEGFAREALNYGHTFGHAVEKELDFKLRHGECVAIGLSFVAYLQNILGTLSESDLNLHLRTLEGLGLPTSYPLPPWEKLNALMLVDKKSRGKKLRLVTLDGIGKTKRLEDPDPQAMIQAYEKVAK